MFFYHDEPNNGYTLEELKPTGADEFRIVPTGKMIKAGNGREKMATIGVFFITTRAGRFEKSEWYRLLEEAVERENKTDLLAWIIKEVERCAWLAKEERRSYALECLASGAYKAWKGKEKNDQD